MKLTLTVKETFAELTIDAETEFERQTLASLERLEVKPVQLLIKRGMYNEKIERAQIHLRCEEPAPIRKELDARLDPNIHTY